MTERYGDFVLYRPPVKATTVLLWGGPMLLLMLGGIVLWRSLARNTGRDGPAPLDAETARHAEDLLSTEGAPPSGEH